MGVLKLLKKVRTNWKKSLFATGVIYYSTNLAIEKYRDNQILKRYCSIASTYGDQLMGRGKLKRVLVILNPASKHGKSSRIYEKQIHPLLSLSGLLVDVVRTEEAGHIKNYIRDADLSTVDRLMIVGGDGTVNEVVTGLMRREDKTRISKIPIAVIPLGIKNMVFETLFSPLIKESKVETLCGSVMRVLEERTEESNVVEVGGSEGDSVYSLTGLSLGVYDKIFSELDQDSVFFNVKKWWRFGKCFFTGERNAEYSISLKYSDPCEGCKACKLIPEIPNSWWNSFTRIKPSPSLPTCDNLINESDLSSAQFDVRNQNGRLVLYKYQKSPTWSDFVNRAVSRFVGEEKGEEFATASKIDLHVDEIKEDVSFNIDGEVFPIRNVVLTLLKNRLTLLV